MAITVFTDGKGFFHQGSGGKGVAPGDVCLSPPPPPAGPLPVPYVNMLSASDLASGSQSVQVDGNPTALEDQSYVSTSTGDEAGTQGGNVMTAQTKGKGYFTLWSFTVKVEGKGVCRHGDPMGQNCASSPPGCVDMQALVSFTKEFGLATEPCKDGSYNRDSIIDSKKYEKQKESVRGGPCWECERDLKQKTRIRFTSGKTKTSAYTSGRSDKQNFTPDHQPPLNWAWYAGGCHMKLEDFKAWANSREAVKPHCATHSNMQGPVVDGVTSSGAANALQKITSFIAGFAG